MFRTFFFTSSNPVISMIASIEGLVAPSMFFCLDHSFLDGDSASLGKGLGGALLDGIWLVVSASTGGEELFDDAFSDEVLTSRPSVDPESILEVVAKISEGEGNICCDFNNNGSTGAGVGGTAGTVG